MSRRLLVTGGDGSLGRIVAERAGADGWEVTAPGRAALDVTDRDEVRAAVTASRPDVVVHAAAMTDVDVCEHDVARAEAVNTRGTANVAGACARAGARLVAVSTDLVFGGDPPRTDADGRPLGWRAHDRTAPMQVYGRTKREGEVRALATHDDTVVARTAVLASRAVPGFVGKVLARARAGQPLRVVTDQVGSPTFVDDLAPALLELAGVELTGVVHRVGEGHCSRHELATTALRLAGHDVEVARVRTADLPAAGAPRPAWSVLDQSRAVGAGLVRLPHWRDGLARLVGALTGASGDRG